MFDLHPLVVALGLVLGLSFGFAFASWYARARTGRSGLVITWLVATALGLALLALGAHGADDRWPKNASEVIEALLIPVIVFGAGALVVEAAFNQATPGQNAVAEEVASRRFPRLGVVLRVVGAMLLAFGVGFCISVGSAGGL